jgi:peptidyl-prolyl cis-trans isomerase A (cyclophilin A)
MIKRLVPLLAAIALARCSGDKGPAPGPAPAPAPAPAPKPMPPPPPPPPPLPEPDPAALLDPKHVDANRQAPAEYRVRFETSRGSFVLLVKRDWAPRGADRFYNLVRLRFFDGCRFFRVLPGFVVQFGISGDPKVMDKWREAAIQDDAVRQSNRRGRITFATAGPNTRTTQVFINVADNPRLDGMGFSPFGEVVEGMDVVAAFYSGYGEGPPMGAGPAQDRLQNEGNAYLEREFGKLDYVKTARLFD